MGKEADAPPPGERGCMSAVKTFGELLSLALNSKVKVLAVTPAPPPLTMLTSTVKGSPAIGAGI
jgi:hypothetical protein